MCIFLLGQDLFSDVSDNTYCAAVLKIQCCNIIFLTLDGPLDTAYYYAYFGRGVGAIHYNCLDCSGTEYRLEDCGSNTQSTSNHNYDWSVTCKNGEHFYFVS